MFLEIKQHQDCLKRKPRTFEFTTMYTSLQHDRVIKNVRKAIEWARQYANEINSTDGRCSSDAAADLVSTEFLMEHVEFIVHNTFFYSGNVVRHQEIGLPMGTNSAPELANLTLHVDEVSFVDALLAENKLEEAKKHSDNFRFIDDILTSNY